MTGLHWLARKGPPSSGATQEEPGADTGLSIRHELDYEKYGCLPWFPAHFGNVKINNRHRVPGNRPV